MRIALLHYSIPPVIGGVESVLAHHARLMADAGHDVQVIAARGEEFAPDITFTWLPLADSRHAEVLSIKAELDTGRVPPGFADLTETLLVEGNAQANRYGNGAGGTGPGHGHPSCFKLTCGASALRCSLHVHHSPLIAFRSLITSPQPLHRISISFC